MKIAIINETFANPIFYRRWELLADSHKDLDVYLLTPEKSFSYASKKNTFGAPVVNEGKSIEKENFHIVLFKIKNVFSLGWRSSNLKEILCEIAPDIIYNIGNQLQFSYLQISRIKKKYLPKAKLIAFSMRGPVYNVDNYKRYEPNFTSFFRRRVVYYNYARIAVSNFNKETDAVFCHYPEAADCFRKEGYSGPIYIQTQVGVNPELFHEDKSQRAEIRSKFGIHDDTYVFGSACRFSENKGLDDIINALPTEGNYKFLIMGSGRTDEEDRIKRLIASRNLDDKVILAGFIQLQDMHKYWNALDCAIHYPRTSLSWVETFSIALVQAMITKLPVIGSNSGSVPYQIGEEGIIVEEKRPDLLKEKIEWCLNNPIKAKEIGNAMFKRADNYFSIFSLNKLFYDTIVQDVITGNYDSSKNMTTYSYENN